MAKQKLKPDDRAQSARFIQIAREVGATGKPEDFDRAFRKIAAAPREAPKPKARKKR